VTSPKIRVSVQRTAPQSRERDVGRDIGAKFAVMSGKGGVGKSFVTANLALGFAMMGFSVGVLDADVYGPTIPKMLCLVGSNLYYDEDRELIIPVAGPLGLKVVSMDFLLPSEDEAVVWRGPMVDKAIKDFLAGVDWGKLDVLFIDLPPGTGDAPLTVAQVLAEKLTGSIVVTIPNDVSRRIVRKAVSFSRKLKIPVSGIVENMCCFQCPESGRTYSIFGELIGERMAKELNVPYLGMIPLDPRIAESNDAGKPFLVEHRDTEAGKAIMNIVDKLIEMHKLRH
jgi:ATP-binding protein involved in chromosome partitioning